LINRIFNLIKSTYESIEYRYSKVRSPRPRLATRIRGENQPEIHLQNIGNERAVKGKITCSTVNGKKILDVEFSHLYPFAIREYVLLGTEPNAKIIVNVEYEGAMGGKYRETQELYVPRFKLE